MDVLLNKVTQQALNYAIRSGIAVTGGYAMKHCSRLLQATPRGSVKDDLRNLQARLESKIRIISPAIDMIELIAARGNTSLETAVQLTKDLRYEIQALGRQLSEAVNEEDRFKRKSSRAKSREQIELGLQLVISEMKKLLTRIEDAVPLINLAITTSGVNLTTNLPATVSPSRLLQASTLLTAADAQYAASQSRRVQVGPTYTLSMYMLFAGHAWRPQDDEDIRATTWKEVIHKARAKMIRVPISHLYETDVPKIVKTSTMASMAADDESAEFAYQLLIIEDLDDNRVHSTEEGEPSPGRFEDVPMAGIRDVIPIHQISKIFYADTGKILNIGSDGEANNPILLLKRDVDAEPPRRMMERRSSTDNELEDGLENSYPPPDDDYQSAIDEQIRRDSTPHANQDGRTSPKESTSWRLPGDLDPEWIAFEVYVEEPDSDDEIDSSTQDDEIESGRSTVADDRNLTSCMARLSVKGRTQESSEPIMNASKNIKTSLSLLEVLIRLTALQQFRQASHLTIEDELLNFFLEDSSTTGAGPNAEYRQRVRRDARLRLGFDPYDESPMKRRGEEYIAHAGDDAGDEYLGDHYGMPDSLPSLVRQSIETPPLGARYSSPSPSMRQMRPKPTSARSSPTPHTPARARPDQPRPGQMPMASRQAMLRSQSEKPRSPLGMQRRVSKTDSGLGTSPREQDIAEAPKTGGKNDD